MLILSLLRRDEGMGLKETVLQMCKNKTRAMFSMAGFFPPPCHLFGCCCFLFKQETTKSELLSVVEKLMS